jgi:DNA-binding NarL/FixJ family response regulator
VAPTAVRAVVIDRDPLWLQDVAAALVRSSVSTVASSGDLSRAPELAEAHAADLLLVGLDQDVDGRELYRLLRRIHKRLPDLVTVVFTDKDDRVIVRAALAGGAYGAVDRRLGTAELVRTVTEAYAAWLEETGVTVRRVDAGALLTRRELEILRLRAQCRSNRELALILWVTDQTIKFHLRNIIKKLDVRNVAEAIRWLEDDLGSGQEGGSGVREPRRPIKPSQTGGASVDPAEAA